MVRAKATDHSDVVHTETHHHSVQAPALDTAFGPGRLGLQTGNEPCQHEGSRQIYSETSQERSRRNSLRGRTVPIHVAEESRGSKRIRHGRHEPLPNWFPSKHTGLVTPLSAVYMNLTVTGRSQPNLFRYSTCTSRVGQETAEQALLNLAAGVVRHGRIPRCTKRIT